MGLPGPVAVAASQQTLVCHALGEAFPSRLLAPDRWFPHLRLSYSRLAPAGLLSTTALRPTTAPSPAIIAPRPFWHLPVRHLGGRSGRKHLLAGIYLARSGAMALFFLSPVTPLSVRLSAAMGLVWLGTVPLTTGRIPRFRGATPHPLGFVSLRPPGRFLPRRLAGAASSTPPVPTTLCGPWASASASRRRPALAIDDRELARPGLAAA